MQERATTENALRDLQIGLFGTKIVEMIETADVGQTFVILCCAASFQAKQNPRKCRQNKNCRKSNTPRVQTKPNKKQKISYYLLHQHKPVL